MTYYGYVYLRGFHPRGFLYIYLRGFALKVVISICLRGFALKVVIIICLRGFALKVVNIIYLRGFAIKVVIIFMHQSFETPAPLPPPHSGLSGGFGGGGAFTSDTLHVGSLVGGEFAGSHGLRTPYRGNKRGSHQTSTLRFETI